MRSITRLGKTVVIAALLPLLLLSACGNEDHTNIFHATFTAGETAKDFTTKVGFTKFITNDYDISYTEGGVPSNPTANYLGLVLPPDVTVRTYHQGDHKVFLQYFDSSGKEFRSDASGASLTITVTAWPGPGGYGRGTFSATLLDEFGQAVAITDGSFEGWIVN